MVAYVPQDLGFADVAPVRIEGEVVADVDPAAVWAVLADHRRWVQWWGDPIVRVEPTSDPESGVGSTRLVVLKPNIGFDERFIAWEPSSLWAFTVVDGPRGFRSVVERCTVHVEGPGRTRVTYRMALEPKRPMVPVVPLLRRALGKALQDAVGRLVEEAVRRVAAGEVDAGRPEGERPDAEDGSAS